MSDTKIMSREEDIVFSLRSLYSSYGYQPYIMSKFEDYDLYGRNKDFLVSDHVITFTDTNGKLKALKPDVTLSIVKNTKYREGTVSKVYYDENVYRVSRGTGTFSELRQVGLECIGDVDDYSVNEALMLAAQTLYMISPDFVLSLSQLDLVEQLLIRASGEKRARQALMKCLDEKNVHDIARVCEEYEISAEARALLEEIASLQGGIVEVIEAARAIAKKIDALPVLDPAREETDTDAAMRAVDYLERATSAIRASDFADKVTIDFSVTGDSNYYNGIIFKGFISGIPTFVLSGGQYDPLLKKLRLPCKAIGFALYVDLLEELPDSDRGTDVDILLLYDDTSDLAAIAQASNVLIAEGHSVMAARKKPSRLTYTTLLEMKHNEVKSVG